MKINLKYVFGVANRGTLTVRAPNHVEARLRAFKLLAKRTARQNAKFGTNNPIPQMSLAYVEPDDLKSDHRSP